MKKISLKKFEQLIDQSESDYLDFKEDYTTNAALFKDILSLANSMSKQKYRFLIFGVADKKDDSGKRPIIGVEGSLRRKKLSDILNLLRTSCNINKMPQLRLDPLDYEGHVVDVLCIENVCAQPYFLKKDYQDKQSSSAVFAGTFYGRVGDKNDPIVDDSQLDAIYRQRFGLDKNPLERMDLYLMDKKSWKCDYNENNVLFFYYIHHPEFTVQSVESEATEWYHEPWATNFSDKNASKQLFLLKYHGTMLDKFVAIWSDGARFLTIQPKEIYEEGNGQGYYFFYYVKNTRSYLLQEMLQVVYPVNGRIIFPVFTSKKRAVSLFKKNLANNAHFVLQNSAWVPVNFTRMFLSEFDKKAFKFKIAAVSI